MIVAIIQARMGSTRLPGKVLMDLNGIPMLQYQVDRVVKSKIIDQVVVATSTSPQDDEIATFCKKNNISFFRGSEDDVLSRYYDAAKKYEVNTIVRITADCPLIDPAVIDRTIELFQKNNLDYASNTAPQENSQYPDGSDVEVFSMSALQRADQEATSKEDREHVTFYFWKAEKKDTFKIAQLGNYENWSKYRFTVDYLEDYQVVKQIDTELKRRNQFGTLEEIIQILKEQPEIVELNAEYYFGIGWE
jgi:spore coat polysaccharide biosynthesis protein SpsF